MTISLGNALKFVNEDEKWISKTVIGGFITLAAIIASAMFQYPNAKAGVIIAGLALYFIFGALLSGFLLSTVNTRLNSDARGLTEWNEPNLLLKGLKFILSYIVYTFVITILFTVIGTVLTIAASIVLGIIYYLISLVLNIDPQVAAYVFVPVFIVLIVIFSLYLMQFISAALTCYYKSLKFRDLMALKKHFRIVFENQHAAWTLIGKIILYSLLFLLVFCY